MTLISRLSFPTGLIPVTNDRVFFVTSRLIPKELVKSFLFTLRRVIADHKAGLTFRFQHLAAKFHQFFKVRNNALF